MDHDLRSADTTTPGNIASSIHIIAAEALRGSSPFAAAILHAVPMPANLPLYAHCEDTPHGHLRGILRIYLPSCPRDRTI